MKVFWVPNADALLAIVTARFVNIYDVSTDTICPVVALQPRAGNSICAATVAFDSSDTRAILVMMQDGSLYSHPLPGTLGGLDGPVTIERELVVPPAIRGTAGRRVFFSARSRVVLCGYENGAALLRLSPDLSSVVEAAPLDFRSPHVVQVHPYPVPQTLNPQPSTPT